MCEPQGSRTRNGVLLRQNVLTMFACVDFSNPHTLRTLTAPICRVNLISDVLMKGGKLPIFYVFNPPVFDGIVMNVIHAIFKIFIISNGVFVKATLHMPFSFRRCLLDDK